MVEHAAGLPEAGGHLADDVETGGAHRRGGERGAVPAGPEVLQQVQRGRGLQAVSLAGRHSRRAQQPGDVHRPERVHDRIVGEHPGQEQRHVPEPAVDSRPRLIGRDLEQARQSYRVEFAEAACPVPRRIPVPAAGDPGEGRQQFGEEQPALGGAEEVSQFRRVEHGDDLAHAGPFGQVVQAGEVQHRTVHGDAEGEEGGRQHHVPGRGEHRLEHSRVGEQALDQARVGDVGAVGKFGGPRQQAQVSAGEMLGISGNAGIHR